MHFREIFCHNKSSHLFLPCRRMYQVLQHKSPRLLSNFVLHQSRRYVLLHKQILTLRICQNGQVNYGEQCNVSPFSFAFFQHMIPFSRFSSEFYKVQFAVMQFSIYSLFIFLSNPALLLTLLYAIISKKDSRVSEKRLLHRKVRSWH